MTTSVSGNVKVLEKVVVEFQVVAEGNKSDLQKGNSEINALRAQISVGSRAASRSADCSACDFQTAGDRSAHLALIFRHRASSI